MTLFRPSLRRLVLLCCVTLLSHFSLRAAEPRERTLIFFGDSLTAGYGLDDPASQAYPALIQQKLATAGLPWRVVNAGLSGETTSGGARRVDWILRQPIDVFVLALGANDGLRGIDLSVSRTNLQRIIERVREKNPSVQVVLAGMMMPPTLGADYTREFAAIYPTLAEKNRATLIPFLLERVGGVAALNQGDQIHPNPAGHAIVADTVWSVIKPLLTP